MNIITRISLICFSVLLFAGCKKELQLLAPTTTVSSDQAKLKINYNSAYTVSNPVQLKLNNNRVSNLITSRTPFPGGGFNTGGGSGGDYLAVRPGLTSMLVSIPKFNTTVDSVVLYSTNLTLEANKTYTAHITDTGANTKVVLLEDNLTNHDTMSRYKFVNLMPNVPFIDLYFGTQLVAANIPYLGASNTFDLPLTNPQPAWAIREAGAAPTSTALATYASGNTNLRGRVYTAFAVGYKGQTTVQRKPYISFLLNR